MHVQIIFMLLFIPYRHQLRTDEVMPGGER